MKTKETKTPEIILPNKDGYYWLGNFSCGKILWRIVRVGPRVKIEAATAFQRERVCHGERQIYDVNYLAFYKNVRFSRRIKSPAEIAEEKRRKTAVCEHCLRRVKVLKGGKLKDHKTPASSGKLFSECAGSGTNQS